MSSQKHRPCGTCPFRRDSTPGYWHREHFQSLVDHCQGDGIRWMSCHCDQSGGTICSGWAYTLGYDAIGLRLAVLLGRFDPDKIDVSGLDLYASAGEMLAANNAVYEAQGQPLVDLTLLRR